MEPNPIARASLAERVLMVRPSGFGFNVETAQTNRFQTPATNTDTDAIHDQALREFDGLHAALEQAGVEVVLFHDEPAPHTPDALFPNNWVSFHAEGPLVLYPMLAANRRQEVRRDWIAELSQRLGVRWPQEIDLTAWGTRQSYLEGTGSLVLDRAQRIAYAALSPRTHAPVLEDFCQRLGYRALTFGTRDRSNTPIYHTNVLMALGPRFALLCVEALSDPQERRKVLDSLASADKELIEISTEQMDAFAGNQLALRGRDDSPLIVLSTRALRSLSAAQQRRLEHHGQLVAVPLDTIESHGGGSARCMLAEIYLPSESSVKAP